MPSRPNRVLGRRRTLRIFLPPVPTTAPAAEISPSDFPLTSLPRELTLYIATFLPPPSVYSLLLASPLFLHISTVLAVLSQQDAEYTHDGITRRMTPLQFFTSCGTGHIVHRLLSIGHDANGVFPTSPNCRTPPLVLAILNHDRILVSLLLSHGADHSTPAVSGVHIPIHTPSTPTTLTLTYRNLAALTPLHIACSDPSMPHPVLIHLLLSSGAQHTTTTTDHSGLTPLHCAAAAGLAWIAQSLLAAGADPNTRDKHGRTPLHHACAAPGRLGGSAAVVVALAAHGADLEAVYHRGAGMMPVHIAAEKGRVGVLRALLNLGVDPDAVSVGREGVRPLHCAVRAGRREVVEVLLEGGADPGGVSTAGRLPGVFVGVATETEWVEWLRGVGVGGLEPVGVGC